MGWSIVSMWSRSSLLNIITFNLNDFKDIHVKISIIGILNKYFQRHVFNAY